MCSNVLPTAPHDEPGLYPQLSPHDFRMQKANEVSAAMNAEVVHYRSVAKKYKRAKKAANWSAAGFGLFSTALSTASLGSALSVIEGFPAKRAYIAFWPIFIFCRIELIFGRLTCFDMKSIVP